MMKLFLQKLPLTDQISFVAKTFRTPHFEVSWHQHPEIELILFTEGAGQSFIGNWVGEYTVGDIFLLGPDLPHTFSKTGDVIASAVVVQFREDFWGEALLHLPESRSIKQLLTLSLQGLKITGSSKKMLAPLIKALEFQEGFQRILTLGECLLILAKEEHVPLSTQETRELNAKEKERVDSIFRYTFDNFREPVSLERVAAIIQMSIPAFCSYFKKRTKKTYINFLNEVRISYACKQLTDTPMSISEICYESGFNTLTNFHRQFRKLKGKTPYQYRSCIAESL